MLTKLRNHLTYANVVSTLCLFILLGGSAFAAVRLSKNSVRSKHIKNEQVQSVDVKNASLLSQDFAPGQLPQGEKGENGEKGATGETGAPGSALAFAAVDGNNGNVVEALSKNIGDANVTNPSAGRYCFDNLPFSAKNVVATPRAQLNVWISATVGGGFDCEADDDAVVKTGAPGSATPADHSFSVLFN